VRSREHVKVEDAIAGLDKLAGTEVEVQGFLVHVAQHLYIAPHEVPWQATDQSILVRDESVVTRLFDVVPSWVGGPSYQDEVTITGKIVRSPVAPFRAAVTNVSGLTLTRDQEVFHVVP
jgi:hypothetical protein